jgi:poly(A) polymerase
VTPAIVGGLARRLLYSWGAATYRDRVLLAWAAGGEAADDAGWRATLAHAAGWIAPHMPVDGEDALAAGAAPGPDVGRLLREVEAWWVAGDFSATREQALAELARRAGRPVA